MGKDSLKAAEDGPGALLANQSVSDQRYADSVFAQTGKAATGDARYSVRLYGMKDTFLAVPEADRCEADCELKWYHGRELVFNFIQGMIDAWIKLKAFLFFTI